MTDNESVFGKFFKKTFWFPTVHEKVERLDRDEQGAQREGVE